MRVPLRDPGVASGRASMELLRQRKLRKPEINQISGPSHLIKKNSL